MLQQLNLASVQTIMTSEEARYCVTEIMGHVGRARALLLDLYERRGWEALGYSTWRECVSSEFGQNQSTLYFQLQAALVERNISNTLENIEPIPMRQLRPLAQLEPTQQIEAWKLANERSDGKPTAAIVQQAVDEVTHKPRSEVIHVSDDSYEWYTPAEYIEAARGLMGGIDLDPASCLAAQQVVQAGEYYTKEQDGLSQPWYGKVWLNPPYSMPHIEQFTGRAIDDYQNGNIEAAVILVNNCTDTGWFHRLLDYPVCFTRGRVQFWTDGAPNLGARQGQAIFYLGDKPDLFSRLFSNFGVVLKRA